MNSEPFVIERTYKAPIGKVWKAITDKDEMKKWYFDLAEFKPEVGFEFRFTGGTPDGVQYLHICTITEVIPEKKLAHTWVYDGHAGSSTVTWELFEEGDSTRVRLTHEGLESFPQHIKDFAKENFATGWTAILGEGLRGYLMG